MEGEVRLPRPRTIAIDGPAAAGKSTIGYELAKRLNYLYLDTGVMYRAVTWAALEQGISVSEERAVTRLSETLDIDILPPTVEDGRQYTVLVDGKDITWRIRDAAVEAGVSAVSSYRGVRQALVAKQRAIGARQSVVMVGRDIGTVVLPDADLKLYLDAKMAERAKRRYDELVERGEKPNYERIKAAMRRRDQIDSGRAISPLKTAQDAVVVDTTALSIDKVLDLIERMICERVG
jgi:cytidylate kinase